ncbi:MAG: polysaccharide deacetylase family protein [Patescibacteria group bacterium]
MWKTFIIRLLYALGIPGLFRALHTHDLTILLYHGVAPTEARGMYNYRGKFIAPEVFKMHLSYIKKYYTVLDLDEALEKQKAGTLPPHSLVITFDDGYKNFYTYAFPLLRDGGVTATFFIPTDFVFEKKALWMDRLEYIGLKNDATVRHSLKLMPDVDRAAEIERLENEYQKKLFDFEEVRSVYAPLSIEGIREMQNAGMKFGAHTQSHPILSKVNRERLEEEILGSKKILEEKIGSISRTFCYPNGQKEDMNNDTKIVIQKEFSAALSTIEGINKKGTDPYELQRISMDALTTKAGVATAISGARNFFRP